MKKTILLWAFLLVTIKLCIAQTELRSKKFTYFSERQKEYPTLYKGIGYSVASNQNGCILGIENVTGISGIFFSNKNFTAFFSTRINKKTSIYCNLVTQTQKRAEVTGEFGVTWIKEKDHFVWQIGTGYYGRYKVVGIYLFLYLKQ